MRKPRGVRRKPEVNYWTHRGTPKPQSRGASDAFTEENMSTEEPFSESGRMKTIEVKFNPYDQISDILREIEKTLNELLWRVEDAEDAIKYIQRNM